MDMINTVSYIPYDASSKERTGNIITFTNIEEGKLLLEYRNKMEFGIESDDDSTPP